MAKEAIKKEKYQQVLDFTKTPQTRGAIADWIGSSSGTVSYMVKALKDFDFLIETGTGKKYKYQYTGKKLSDYIFALVAERMVKHRVGGKGTGTPNKEKFDKNAPIAQHVEDATEYVEGTNKGHRIIRGFSGFHGGKGNKTKIEVRRDNSSMNRF